MLWPYLLRAVFRFFLKAQSAESLGLSCLPFTSDRSSLFIFVSTLSRRLCVCVSVHVSVHLYVGARGVSDACFVLRSAIAG